MITCDTYVQDGAQRETQINIELVPSRVPQVARPRDDRSASSGSQPVSHRAETLSTPHKRFEKALVCMCLDPKGMVFMFKGPRSLHLFVRPHGLTQKGECHLAQRQYSS